MADKTYNLLIPGTKAVDNGDGTYSISTVASVDGFSGISVPQRNKTSLDSLFLPYRIGTKMSDYWIGATSFTLKHGFWAFNSKRSFSNGLFSLYAKLNTFNTTWQFFGMEAGPGTPALTVVLGIGESGAALLAHFRFESQSGFDRTMLTINSLIPADYDTVKHTYSIKINQNNVLLWIDSVLIGVGLLGLQEGIPEWEDNPPYVLGSIVSPSTSGPLLVGMEGDEYVEWEVYWNGLMAVDAEPITPLGIPLYNENTATKWTGLATAGALQTSHPVPVWGYTNKSLYFMATGAGTLTVQIYAGGGWRTIATPIVAANTLVVYALASETPIARCTYDPSNNDIITLAEWCLS